MKQYKLQVPAKVFHDMKYFRFYAPAFISFLVLLFICSLIFTSSAKALEGELLEKVYKLDAEMAAGICPEELKRVRLTSAEVFGCDRVRIQYGYRSIELAQCRLRNDLANEIIREYNAFIEQCKNEKNNLN